MTPSAREIFLKGLWLLNLKLDSQQFAQFSIYLNELKNWNSRFNLIGPASDGEIIKRHFLDSLSIVPALPDTNQKKIFVLDVGTGAGFPGIPLKIAMPEISLTLLDSSKKKTEFLRHLCKRIDIATEIVCGRAEDVAIMSTHSGKYDIVTARAVTKISAIGELCFPFLNKKGVLILQAGKEVNAEIKNGEVMLKFNVLPEILPGKSIIKVKKNPTGFTLIELMIVVAIIGILAAIAIPKFGEVLKRTKQGKTKGSLGALRSALTLYYSGMEGAMYPDSGASISNELGPVRTKYLDKIEEVKLGPTLHEDTNNIEDFDIDEVLTDTGEWGYIAVRGSIFVNCNHLDISGAYISSW